MHVTKGVICCVVLAVSPLFWYMAQADDVQGTPANDVLNGTNGADTIKGEGGDDTIDGKSGNDTIDGGDGADTITGGDGEDTIEGGKGNDRIDGGPARDTIVGGPGDDTIDGGLGDDDIRGGDGTDTIDGGLGNDRVVAGPGLDVYAVAVNNGSDRVTIRAGDVPTDQMETVRCGSGKDKVKFIGFPANARIPGTRDFKDPDTGGTYRIDPDCEDFLSNPDFALLDSQATPSVACAAPGALVSVKGLDFPPLAAIVVSMGKRAAGQFETDAEGAFAASFKVPQAPPGTYEVELTNAASAFKNRFSFTVVDRSPAAQQRGGCAY